MGPVRGLVVSGGRSDQFDTATNRSTTWSPSSVMSDRPTVTAPSRVQENPYPAGDSGLVKSVLSANYFPLKKSEG